jgi:hypothetical protein
MISSTEVASLISKYKSESKRVRIFFIARDKSVNLRLTASVLDFVESDRLTLFAPNGASLIAGLFTKSATSLNGVRVYCSCTARRTRSAQPS